MLSFSKYINEGKKGKSLIICDVQPHDVGSYIRWDMSKFAKFVNSYDSVLVLYNGADMGWETENDMYDYYDSIGIDVNKCEFVEKYYAYFREWIDAGMDYDDMMVLLTYMLKKRIWDSDDEHIRQIAYDELGISLDDYGYSYIPIDIAKTVKGWSGSDLCGGGKHECLYELEMLMDLYKIKYKTQNKWVY